MSSARTRAAVSARGLRQLLSLVYWRQFGAEQQRLLASHALLSRAASRIMPEYRMGDFAKAWWEDEEYLERYRELEGERSFSADRMYQLRELAKLVDHLEGDTAEAGVYRGTSSWFICDARRGRASTHWAFDSFEGLSEPLPIDGEYWHRGDMPPVRTRLGRCSSHSARKWSKAGFPTSSPRPRSTRWCSRTSTWICTSRRARRSSFLSPTASGGLIVCDDYGLTTCPGSTRAFDEYFDGKPEPIVRCATGQCFVIKR